MLGLDPEKPVMGVFPGILDEDTVEWIKRHPKDDYHRANVGNGDQERLDTEIRDVERAQINIFTSPHLCGILNHFVTSFNSLHYCYEVSGINQIEMLRYVSGGKYEVHRDTGDYVEYVKRKFTVIVQLSDDRDYEGCELVVPMIDEDQMTPEDVYARRQKGTVIIFPSYLPHFITPLTRGQRTSIVSWATGPGVR